MPIEIIPATPVKPVTPKSDLPKPADANTPGGITVPNNPVIPVPTRTPIPTVTPIPAITPQPTETLPKIAPSSPAQSSTPAELPDAKSSEDDTNASDQKWKIGGTIVAGLATAGLILGVSTGKIKPSALKSLIQKKPVTHLTPNQFKFVRGNFLAKQPVKGQTLTTTINQASKKTAVQEANAAGKKGFGWLTEKQTLSNYHNAVQTAEKLTTKQIALADSIIILNRLNKPEKILNKLVKQGLTEEQAIERMRLFKIKVRSTKNIPTPSNLNNSQYLDEYVPQNGLVRNVNNDGNALPLAYRQNSAEARYRLELAINNGSYASVDKYEEALKQAHKLAYSGSSGKNLYYADKARNGQMAVINAGKIRAGGHLQNGYSGEASQVEAIAQRLGDPFKINNNGFQVVKLDGIPASALPANNNIMHIYPPGYDLKNYLNVMQSTGHEAVQLIQAKAESKTIVNKIAEHYQVSVNARPFEQINNSLFMNEANLLLKKAGLNEIPHGILDHVAHRLQPANFKTYFYEQVKLANPGI